MTGTQIAMALAAFAGAASFTTLLLVDTAIDRIPYYSRNGQRYRRLQATGLAAVVVLGVSIVAVVVLLARMLD